MLGLAGDISKDYDVCTSRFQYYHTALIPIGVVVIFQFAAIFIPETPRWLFSHGKDSKAEKVLKLLRGSRANTASEREGIKKTIEKDQDTTLVLRIRAFRRRSVMIPFVLVLFLMFFQQFSGINAVIFYAGSIFVAAGVAKPQLVNALSVGLVQIFATLASVFAVDRLGRKVLLILSSAFMLISSLLQGSYFLVLNHYCGGCIGSVNACNGTRNVSASWIQSHSDICENGHFSGLAIAATMVFIIAFSLGWGPIPWSSMSELLPLTVRGLAGSMATFVNWTFATIVTAFFESYAQKVTPKLAWWSFALVSAVSLVFIVLFLPETKNRQLEEIEDHFEEGHILAVSCGKKCGDENKR